MKYKIIGSCADCKYFVECFFDALHNRATQSDDGMSTTIRFECNGKSYERDDKYIGTDENKED